MTPCEWSILIIILLVLAIFSILGKYWRQSSELRTCWNDGWFLPLLKWFFWILSWLSLGRVIPYWIENTYGKKARFFFIDTYVFLWIVFVTTLAILEITSHILVLDRIILSFLGYRLFEIFQSWVSQYILGGVPTPLHLHNPYRTLIIVFIDYVIMTLAYALFRVSSGSFSSGLRDSLNIAVFNIPSTQGVDCLLVTQITFAILFLVTAINRIYATLK